MQANRINGWREVLARVTDGADVQYGITPDWLVNPGTNRKLKLDYLYPDMGLAVRFVGLQGTTRRQRKSDEEVMDEAEREKMRAAVCRAHGVTLLSIDPDADPKQTLRDLELVLAAITTRTATGNLPHSQKQRLMPLLSQMRRKAGEFTTRLSPPEKLMIYAEMWWERQQTLQQAAPPEPGSQRFDYRVGMQVVHQKFGPGTVTDVQPDGDDLAVTVNFVEAGVRTFGAALVGDKLQPEEW